MSQPKNIFLKPSEARFFALATVFLIDELEEGNKLPDVKWNDEAKRYFKEILEAGKSLQIKLTKLGFDMSPLPPFIDGDEKEFTS